VLAEHRAELANARAGRAEAMATTDALTGIGNQRAWWHRMNEEESRRARTPRPSAVAVIDLDDLKLVNDERGHLHGDLLLRLAAETLRRAVRSFDVVARVGGDEFAILAVDFDGNAAMLRDRIAEALSDVEIQASIGVAVPADDGTLIEAYAAADRAMYADKRSRQHQSARGA
jgi:diguanylate cyclase (GGDEF)-like protein